MSLFQRITALIQVLRMFVCVCVCVCVCCVCVCVHVCMRDFGWPGG